MDRKRGNTSGRRTSIWSKYTCTYLCAVKEECNHGTGFYTEKKKAGPSNPSPKAVAQPTGNTTMLEGLGGCNGKEGGETKVEEVQGLVGNDNSALNSNNLGPEVMLGIHNMINQEIMSESVTTVQPETQLRGSNVELAKSD